MEEKTRKTVAIWLLGIGIVIPLFNIWAAWLLRKSCSPVLRLFFKRFWVATVVVRYGGALLVALFNYAWSAGAGIMGVFSDGPIWMGPASLSMLISLITSVFMILLLMSGSELITRYYRLDMMTASKVRLFQMGALIYPLFSFLPYVVVIVNLLMFLGLMGIIRSDLLTEERSGEDCGVVKVAWWSRPVVAMVCFYGCLLVLGGLILGLGGYNYL